MTAPSSRQSPAIIGGVLLLAAFAVLARVAAIVPPLFLERLGLALIAFVAAGLALFGVGSALLRAAARRAPRDADDLLLVPASGAALLIGLTGFLGWVGLLRPAVLGLLLVPAVGWGAFETARWWRSAAPLPRPPRIALLLLVPLGAVVMGACGTESAFYDQLHYHLAFPYQWLRAGHVIVFPRQAYSFLPQNLGLLYTWALAAGGGAVAAQAIHALCGVLAIVGAARLAARLAPQDAPGAPWWAVSLLATSPMVLLTATWAASDLGVAAFGAAAFLAAVRASEVEDPDAGLLRAALSGVFAGLAAGTKLTGIVTVAVPAGLLVLLLPLFGPRRRGPGQAIAAAALFAGALSVSFAPWAIRNAVVAGNPFHPYLASWFGATGLAAPAGRIGGAALHSGGLLLAPTFGIFEPRGAAGIVGAAFPVVLAGVVVSLVTMRSPSRALRVIVLVALAAGTCLWSVLEPLGRYLAPELVLLAALGGPVLAAVGHRALQPGDRWSRLPGAAAIGLVVLAMFWTLPAGLDEVTWRRVSTTFGHGPADAELRRGASYWPAVPFIRDELPERGRLLMVAESRTWRIDRDPVVEDPFETPLLIELAMQAPSPVALAELLRERNITHVLFNAAEASRMARLNGREDYWAAGSPEARAVVFSFWKRCLEQRFREGSVAVYALTDCRPAGTPAAR